MEHKDKLKYFAKKWSDRADGWRIRNVDPVFMIIPYVLRSRLDSQNYFEERIVIDHIEDFIRKHKSEIPELSIMHVVMAAMVRLVSQRPYLNRFVVWNKLYARDEINIALAIKRSLSDDGEESMIKPSFLPTDTLYDIVRKVNAELEKSKPVGKQNDSDTISKLLGKLPPFFLRFVIGILRQMDNFGILPKVIRNASPWHASVFLTNLGSIGIESIYHHLYEFGTCSTFLAMGRKSRINTLQKDGTVKTEKSILLKFVLDERICDGFYNASSLKLITRYFNNPEVLLTPPDRVVIDDGVGRKRIDL